MESSLWYLLMTWPLWASHFGEGNGNDCPCLGYMTPLDLGVAIGHTELHGSRIRKCGCKKEKQSVPSKSRTGFALGRVACIFYGDWAVPGKESLAPISSLYSCGRSALRSSSFSPTWWAIDANHIPQTSSHQVALFREVLLRAGKKIGKAFKRRPVESLHPLCTEVQVRSEKSYSSHISQPCKKKSAPSHQAWVLRKETP